MKFFRSIRWRLQLWYGALLVLVLLGFGISAWRLQSANQLGRVDQEIEQRMGIVSDMVRPRGGPAPERPPGGGPPPDWKLPDRKMGLFEGMEGRAFYYVVWFRHDRDVMSSPSAPSDVPRPDPMHGPPVFRTRGTFRECYHDTPSGECLLVGRDIRADLAEIRRFGWLLTGAGGSVLLLGIAGGWWIATRALRPIGDISATAARISSGDLSMRIHTADTESELGLLAGDLNHTFAQLQDAFARQAQFTADASHELRTPVAVVLAQTQSALIRERPAVEYREYLEACQRAAKRMRGIIENLLALARLDSADSKSVREPCALDRIARETADLLEPVARERNVHLDFDVSPVRCMANAGQLAQVVSNLVSNAIHYNRPDGKVRVRVANESDMAILSVSDTGQGIPPEDLPHIFERFYRVDKSRSAAQGHSGLGLAITKAIVEGHGGTIEVSSEPGQGSTFEVRLPVESFLPG